MVKLKIKITQKLIDESVGCQMRNDSCLFARALREIMPEARVSLMYIFPTDLLYQASVEPIMYHNPVEKGFAFNHGDAITSYIREFDKTYGRPEIYKDIKPAEFELEVPDWAIEAAINIDDVKKILENSETLELIQ